MMKIISTILLACSLSFFDYQDSISLRILSIEQTDNNDIIVLKTIDDKGEKYKVISYKRDSICDEDISLNKEYRLVLYSAFSMITKSDNMTGFGIGDILVKTEPENGYNHLYVSPSFNGHCYVYP